jgi:MoaA/NifB/PqqE/SkfB family radical SAM enzyme
MFNYKYKIPDYSEDRSGKIGEHNLKVLQTSSGKLNFTGVYIHLAPVCNMRCKGCFTHVDQLGKERLNFNTIKRIIDFAKDSGARTIILAGAGEPTFDPEFKRVRGYIKEQDLKTVLFTNLSTIKNENEAKSLLEDGPVIGKLFTLNKRKYDDITNCSNAYDAAIDGLCFLLDAKVKLEKEGKVVTLALDSYITRDNYMDLPELLRYCRKREIIPYFEAFIELGQSAELVKELALSEKELRRLFRELKQIDKEEFNIDVPLHPCSRNYGQDVCKKSTHMFSVRQDGQIYMCVCSLRPAGNVYQRNDPYESLRSIFMKENKWLIDYFICDECSQQI